MLFPKTNKLFAVTSNPLSRNPNTSNRVRQSLLITYLITLCLQHILCLTNIAAAQTTCFPKSKNLYPRVWATDPKDNSSVTLITGDGTSIFVGGRVQGEYYSRIFDSTDN